MDAENYVIQYPLDAVHVDKFADLLGNGSPLKPHEIAPSARLTRSERMQITRIRVDLAQNGIRPQRWELEALARGATVNYDGKKFTYPVADEWPGFSLPI